MKLQILSDIHLEFGIRKIDFLKSDIIILAGDIHLGIKGLEWISEKIKDKPVVYVLGNHEYYKNSYPKLIYKLREASKNTNINVLENESIILNDITFHGTTLWTDFELFGNARLAGFECQQKMNDYHLIRRDPSYSKLRSIDTHVMHNESKKWLAESLAKSKTSINVVVTHHAPSIQSVPEQYKKDIISAAFASNMEDFINQYEPNLWIHGHIHTSADYQIGKTRIICNPTGYPDEKVDGFISNLLIEINS